MLCIKSRYLLPLIHKCRGTVQHHFHCHYHEITVLLGENVE
jgi:hypothetical protein